MAHTVTNEQIAVILENIDSKIDRLVFRADRSEEAMSDTKDEIAQLRTRISLLEHANEASDKSLSTKLSDGAWLVALGILLTYVGKQLGLV